MNDWTSIKIFLTVYSLNQTLRKNESVGNSCQLKRLLTVNKIPPVGTIGNVY